MRVTFDLVQRDFLEAYRLHREAQRIAHLLRGLFFATLLAAAYVSYRDGLVAGALCLSAALVVFGVLFSKPHVDAHHAMRRSRFARPGVVVEFSEEGAIETIEDFEHRWHWSSVRHFLETPNLLLFHHHDGSRTIIPKRAFSAAQLEQLHALAQVKLPPYAHHRG